MITKDEAKQAIIREWLTLLPAERATEQQAVMFAMKMKDRYRFRASGDPYQHIKGWLLPYVPKP